VSKPKIRHIATSYDGNVIAAGEFIRRVHTWNIETKKKLTDFDTVLEPGGSRLAISRDGRLCAAGAYDGGSLAENRYVGGSVAAYDTSTGEMLWQNKRIKRVQGLKFSTHCPEIIYAVFSDQPMNIIDTRTGSVVEKIRDTRGIWESPYEGIQMRESSRGDYLFGLSTGKRIGQLTDRRLGPLDVAFSDIYVVVSYGRGPVSCYSTENCIQVWRHDSEEGHHYVEMRYNEKSHEFIGVDLDYLKGASSSVVWLDEATGAVKRKLTLSGTPWETEFALKGTVLVTSDGVVMDTGSGEEIARLDFPREVE